MPAVRIANVSIDGTRLLVTRFRRDTANTEPESLVGLCELSPGEARICHTTPGEVLTVVEICASTASTFAHQLAHFRASAAAYQFELTQEELERAIREEANPCANAN